MVERVDDGVPPAMTPTGLPALPSCVAQVGGVVEMELTEGYGSIAVCVTACDPAEVGEESGAASDRVEDEAGTVTEVAVMGRDAAACGAAGGCRRAKMWLRAAPWLAVEA